MGGVRGSQFARVYRCGLHAPDAWPEDVSHQRQARSEEQHDQQDLTQVGVEVENERADEDCQAFESKQDAW